MSSKLGMTLLSSSSLSSWSTVGPIAIRLEFYPLSAVLLSDILVFMIGVFLDLKLERVASFLPQSYSPIFWSHKILHVIIY